MLSVLLWKEYREHRMVWGALAFLGAAMVLSRPILLGAGLIDPRSEARQIVLAISALLVGVYSLICGAMMLAGERENGTMPYLDALPGLRRRVWQGKFVAGLLLVVAQIVLLMSLSAAVSLFENGSEAAWTLGAMAWAGLFGLSWGMLFSSWGRNVTNVILMSVAGYMALGFVAGILTVFFVGLVSVIFGIAPRDPPVFPAVVFVGFYALIVPAALAGSALVFTRLDRIRIRPIAPPPDPAKRKLRLAWPALFWLTFRQAYGFTAGLAIFALFLGFITLLQPFLIWPAATLIVGVLCGATAFADEQQGPYRFLGDQRLPLGRLWLVKIGGRFGIAVLAALLVLAPSFIGALAGISESRWNNPAGPYYFFAHVFRSGLLVSLCPSGLFLTLWLVYGFAAGCLFGLLFRHGLAAGVFALFTCSLAAALWIPSLLSGGLHAWQVFGPPVLLLIATRLLLRPWAAGRIVSWTTALRLTPFVLLAGLWTASGLWYRVLEIPNVPQRIDVDAFRASLPTPEQNEGGRLLRSACLRFDDLRHTLQAQQAPQGGAPGGMGAVMAPAAPGLAPPQAGGGAPGLAVPAPMPGAANVQPPALQPEQRADEVLEHGWPADDHALAVWLDKLYAGEWAPMLKQAADLPTGPFDDVRNLTVFNSLSAAQAARELAVVLVARGLQRQAAGDDEAYVENLRIGLALSRSLRDRTPMIDVLVGRSVEGGLRGGLDRWLEKLHGRSDLIRKALSLLSHHLDETAQDDKDRELVEALIAKNALDDPFHLLQDVLSSGGDLRRPGGPEVRDEAEWVATAWLVPWEHARQNRIFRVAFNGDQEQRSWLLDRREDVGPLWEFARLGPDINRSVPRQQTAARAMQLKLALRWYQVDTGQSAENLDELVPKYLPSIPLDPYDGAPFRYRLSRGEEIEWPSDPPDDPNAPILPPMGGQPGAVPVAVQPTTRKIPPGQGVLWSVGEDKIDNGGHRQSAPFSGQGAPGEDLIFLVPRPPQAK
jgi:ABC-2 family transporter protein